MKKYLWMTIAVLMSLLVATPVLAQHGMGGGMMGGRGYGYGQSYAEPGKPMEMKGAKTMMDDYLKSTRNPNLKLGKIKDKGTDFEAEILTKNNALVDKILINKQTGRMSSAY